MIVQSMRLREPQCIRLAAACRSLRGRTRGSAEYAASATAGDRARHAAAAHCGYLEGIGLTKQHVLLAMEELQIASGRLPSLK